MKASSRWTQLGFRHVVWELMRFYHSFGDNSKNLRKKWADDLQKNNALVTEGGQFPVEAESVALFFEYLRVRDQVFNECLASLRTEEAAAQYCHSNNIPFGKTETKNKDHHQASKALVAAVARIAEEACKGLSVSCNTNPQSRCVWCADNGLHVTARNLDGAIPSLSDPVIIWEVKEYWGKTKGGSKMSDGVYECHLVGRELREFEELSGITVTHAVFVDGKEQWGHRKSDLKRLIDLTHQGFIDQLFVGSDVETQWSQFLLEVLKPNAS